MKPSYWLVAAFLVAIVPGLAWSQQPAASADKPENKRAAWLHETYLGEASEYEFFLDATQRQKLELRREPVMKWTSENDYTGEVYVWTYQGSAKVVGCIFSGPYEPTSRLVMHEFHSLVPQPLHGAKKGGSRWLAEEPGLKFEPIVDAPEPASNPARRLTQMRDLARRFTAQVDRSGNRSEMRLLPQPIYRNEIGGPADPVLDGAVFTFVWSGGTDPEVLVLIEAQRTEKGLRWMYAAARFTNVEAWLKYDNKEVWRAAPSPAGIFDGVTTKAYGAARVKPLPYPDGMK